MLIGRRALRYPHSCWTGGVIPVWRCSRDGRFSAGKSAGRCCVAVPFGVTLRSCSYRCWLLTCPVGPISLPTVARL